MGNYNADKNYNMPQMADIAKTKNFIPIDTIYSDQWSLDSANRVSSFHDGTGNIKIHIKFDPRQIP